MGLSVTANLYYGVKYDKVFKNIETIQEYHIHDIKTGLKTGEIGLDIIKHIQNIHTNEIFDIRQQPYGIFPGLMYDDFIFYMKQEGQDHDCIIGICVAFQDEYSDNDYYIISEEKLDSIKDAFEKKFRKYIGDLKPELMLNLYQIY